MKPLDHTVGYLIVYRFDSSPQLNRTINLIDGWTLFCPFGDLFKSNLNQSNENIYKYFLDNEKTKSHQSLIFGIRELNSTELMNDCANHSINRSAPISDQPFHFTFNYELRFYTSGCYYFDEMSQRWKSDGLLVSYSSLFFRNTQSS